MLRRRQQREACKKQGRNCTRQRDGSIGCKQDKDETMMHGRKAGYRTQRSSVRRQVQVVKCRHESHQQTNQTSGMQAKSGRWRA